MKTRFCNTCGEPYQSDAVESVGFCCQGCRELWYGVPTDGWTILDFTKPAKKKKNQEKELT